MTKLADAIGRLPESDRHGAMIFDAIREGLSPFKAYMIQVYLEYDIDFHRYWVVADVRFRSGYRLCYKEPSDAWDVAADPDKEMYRIAGLMLQAFRNREDFALAPLISLGEN